jgi:FkbM family methyltransferase
MNSEVRQLIYRQEVERLSSNEGDRVRSWPYDVYQHNAMAGEFDNLLLFVKPGMAAVDVGANVGQYAIKLAANCPQVLAIEPLSEYSWLHNDLPRNCLFANVAVGENEGHTMLSIPVSNGQVGYGQATLHPEALSQIDTWQEESVQVRTLDNLCSEMLPNQSIGFIKLDIEGAEVEALKGATRILERDAPNLQMEIWASAVPETARFVEGLGYRGVFFFGGVLFDIATFDAQIHCAPENEWREGHPYDSRFYVNNFFFVSRR